MRFLVTFLGVLVSLWGTGVVGSAIDGADPYSVGFGLFLEIGLIIPYAICMYIYCRPAYQEKRKKALAARAERWEKEARLQKLIKEAREAGEKARTTVVSTRLLGTGASKHKGDLSRAAMGAAVGGLLAGSPGAMLGGIATYQSIRNKKQKIQCFLVKYQDGHVEEREATVGSKEYKLYIEHLVWDE